jgi:Na+/H+-dicarboxylate symporter
VVFSDFFKNYKFLIFIIFSVFAGILIGCAKPPDFVIDIFSALASVLSTVIKFCIPLIIIAFVTQGITSLEKSSGKILGFTVGISYIFMLMAAAFAYMVSKNVFPYFFGGALNIQNFGEVSRRSIFEGMPQIKIEPIMDIFPAILISFIIGLGINAVKAVNLKSIIYEFYRIVEILVRKIIITILPFYVMANFAKLASSGNFFKIASSFYKIFIVIILINIIFLLFQFAVASFVSGKKFFLLLKKIVPVYFTAFATQSSAAVLPTTIENAKKTGISHAVVNFVIPLCSTIHLSGAIISVTSGAMAVMMANGREVLLSSMVPFILMLGIIMIAAPGVPCGAILAAVSLLVSFLNFSPSMVALAIALHMCQDSFGTACNACGDIAVAVIVDKSNYFLQK